MQWGMEARLAYVDELAALPARTTDEGMESAHYLATLTAFQHPDHDTDTWPPAGGRS